MKLCFNKIFASCLRSSVHHSMMDVSFYPICVHVFFLLVSFRYFLSCLSSRWNIFTSFHCTKYCLYLICLFLVCRDINPLFVPGYQTNFIFLFLLRLIALWIALWVVSVMIFRLTANCSRSFFSETFLSFLLSFFLSWRLFLFYFFSRGDKDEELSGS